MKTTPKGKARKNGKARKQKHGKPAKLWAYAFEDGQIVSDLQPSAADLKAGWWKPVALLTLSESADAERIEAGARALTKILPNAEPWKSCLEWQRDEFRVIARAVLLSIGAISAPPAKTTKRKEGKREAR